MADNWYEDYNQACNVLRDLLYQVSHFADSMEYIGIPAGKWIINELEVAMKQLDIINKAVGRSIHENFRASEDALLGTAAVGIITALRGADDIQRAIKDGRAELAQEVLDYGADDWAKWTLDLCRSIVEDE